MPRSVDGDECSESDTDRQDILVLLGHLVLERVSRIPLR